MVRQRAMLRGVLAVLGEALGEDTGGGLGVRAGSVVDVGCEVG